MKSKIIIGILTATTIGSGGYVIYQNQEFSKKINEVNTKLESKITESKPVELTNTSNDNVEDENNIKLQAKLNELETTLNEKIINIENTLNSKIDNLNIKNYDSEISNIKTSIDTLKNIVNTNHNDSGIVGKWKIEQENIIYEFFEDGTMTANGFKGHYSNGVIIMDEYMVLNPYNNPLLYSKINDNYYLVIIGPHGIFYRKLIKA